MLTVSRNRILQSLLMTMVFTCHTLHIPVIVNEIKSFPWLSEGRTSEGSFFHFNIRWSDIVVQIISGEFLQSTEGTLFGDLIKVK